MKVNYGFDIGISTMAPTAVLTRLDVHTDRLGDVVYDSGMRIVGAIEVQAFTDPYGNRVRKLITMPGQTQLTLSGCIDDSGLPEAQIADDHQNPLVDLPDDVHAYLLPSRYCESDLLTGQAWQLFGHIQGTGARVRAVVDFVHNHLQFGYQFADCTRTALQAFNGRAGVCRDFAHLTIALLRSLNIPSRYVNGYLGDIGIPANPSPMDFSAWVEVFAGGQWFTVDARHNEPRIGRIVIARGLDATDVPMIHSFGAHTLTRFFVTTEEIKPGSHTLQIAA
jgi:transglutaminase-like putative cysteine protease